MTTLQDQEFNKKTAYLGLVIYAFILLKTDIPVSNKQMKNYKEFVDQLTSHKLAIHQKQKTILKLLDTLAGDVAFSIKNNNNNKVQQ